VRVTRVLVLNGPNLGRLGTRSPEIYGSETLEDLREQLSGSVPDGSSVDVRQTDDEGTLIGWLHEAVDEGMPVILNPAAFTHYSYALRDAVAIVTEAGLPLIEVHLSNPHSREEFRHTSVITGVATGVIAGLGFDSYRLALSAVLRRVTPGS
jgi:3-dehydroquinate dehydratase-2